MDTAIGTFQADKEAAFPRKLGEVKPIDIVSPPRRGIDEDTVADLIKELTRDGGLLHPITVWAIGPDTYLLVAGEQRLEAWKRHFGEHVPILAIIYPPDTPKALITVIGFTENLCRKDLTPAQRQAQTILLAAALKELDCEKSLTPASDSGETETGNQVPRLAPTAGGRGNKGVAQRIAEKVGITKRAVRKRLKAASAAIGEKIDLDHDTPEELERKAAELERKAAEPQRAEPKTERPKHRDRAPREMECDSGIEAVWKAYSALDENAQAKFILRACRSRGWALRMGPRCRAQAIDEAVALPPKAAPADYDTAADSQPEQREDGANDSADDLHHPGDGVIQAADQEDVGAKHLQDADHASEDGDNAAEGSDDHNAGDVSANPADHTCDGAEHADQEDHGAEHLQDADAAVSEAADAEAEVATHLPAEVAPATDNAPLDLQAEQQEDAADVGAKDLHDAGDDVPEATVQVIGVKDRCARCNVPLLSKDLARKVNGRFYHRHCVDHAKPIAIAAA